MSQTKLTTSGHVGGRAPELTPLRLKSLSVVYALVPGRWAAEDLFSATAA
jgi:hypothetical protein